MILHIMKFMDYDSIQNFKRSHRGVSEELYRKVELEKYLLKLIGRGVEGMEMEERMLFQGLLRSVLSRFKGKQKR